MRSPGPIVVRALIISGSLAASAPTAAQTAPSAPQQPVALNEAIEVVATRVPAAPHDVPVSVEVLNGETLHAMGATNLREALSLAAGVEVAPGGMPAPPEPSRSSGAFASSTRFFSLSTISRGAAPSIGISPR
jgi:hypothetical protein